MESRLHINARAGAALFLPFVTEELRKQGGALTSTDMHSRIITWHH